MSSAPRTFAGSLDNPKGRIKLNVGGVKYETTLATLTADGDKSMLGAMFSGRSAPPFDEDGEVFFDRDGKHFGNVLNVLRGCGVMVSNKHYIALTVELLYYGISDARCVQHIGIIDEEGRLWYQSLEKPRWKMVGDR